MREITYNNGDFGLKIDGEPYKVEFCLGIYRQLGIDALDEMQEFLSKSMNMFEAAVCLFNENIKRYNKEYNGNEKPMRYSELLDALPESTDGIKRLETWIKYKHIMSRLSEKKEKRDSSDGDIKPTVARLIVVGTAILGLSLDDVLGLSIKELDALADAYNALHKTDKDKNGYDDIDTDYANEGVIKPPVLVKDGQDIRLP